MKDHEEFPINHPCGYRTVRRGRLGEENLRREALFREHSTQDSLRMENALDHQEPAAETSYESTRSARTISNYRYRFNRLYRLTLERMKYYGLPPDERLGIAASVKEIVDELELFAETASASNFQTYRTAVLYHLVDSVRSWGEIVFRKLQSEIDRAKKLPRHELSKPRKVTRYPTCGG